jgi:hypothetical protein
MTSYLFPRLATGNAKLLSSEFGKKSPLEIQEELPVGRIQGVSYAPTGGAKVPDGVLEKLRSDILVAARKEGFPKTRSREGQRGFDLNIAHILSRLPVITGDALRDEVWQYLTCKVIPDVVAWRYGAKRHSVVRGPTSEERFLGGVRNVLQRMWWRAKVLRDPTSEDELWLLNTSAGGLTEDNLVSLLERSNVAAYRELCRCIAVEFVKHRQYVGGSKAGSTESLFRDVMKRVVRLLAFANVDALREEQRARIIRDLFTRSVRAMGGEVKEDNRVYEKMADRILRPIDLPYSRSNQHEIQGVTKIRKLLGSVSREFVCRWRAFTANGSPSVDETSTVKWYDARASNPKRSEWRLYYPAGTPLEHANEGDLLVLAKKLDDDTLEAFVIPKSSRKFSIIYDVLKGTQQTEISDQDEETVRHQLIPL